MLDAFPPVVLALTCAFLFALGGQIQSIGLQTMEARTGTMVSIGSNAVFYWLLAPWLLNPAYFFTTAVIYFAMIGLIRPAISANLAVAALRHIGPTLTTTLSSTSPLFAAAIGVFLLDEMLTWQIIIGTIGIIMAIVSLSLKDKAAPTTFPLWALALPIGAAFIRSVGHGITKIGMIEVPDPYFAAMIGASVSFVITFTLWAAKGERKPIDFKTVGPYWFMSAGWVYGFALISLNTALLHGEMITVVPIVASAPIFSMLMSIFVFRRERVTMRIFIAVGIVMTSVVLISLGH